MDEKLVIILNEMAEVLNISQMKKLQEVLLKNLSDNAINKEDISNAEYVQMYLDAKKIEGCSERTIEYYRSTIEKFLAKIDSKIRKITTEQIRICRDRKFRFNGERILDENSSGTSKFANSKK